MLTAWKIQKMKGKEISLLTVFVVCLAMTMLLCVMNKGKWLNQSDVLSPESLSLIKYQSYNKGTLFFYIVQKRIWLILFLFLISTTYLASPAVFCTVIWYGIACGSVLSVLLLRYGGRGLLFLLFCGFPQYLFYIVAWLMAFRLSMTQRTPDQRFFVQLLVLESVVFVGCFCESFINSMILPKIVKIFIGV